MLALLQAAFSLALAGCDLSEDDIEDILDSRISGRVTDNRGQPLAGATVRLYDLAENTHFVTGSDIRSAEAYIEKAAILGSDNVEASAQTGDDGRFLIEGEHPSAFLAVATRDGCTAGFAGFDEETGVLNLDTLLVPDLGLDFAVPDFVLACATPPVVGPDGNSDEAPSFEPTPPEVSCDAEACTAAGGTCVGDSCAITCAAGNCTASGGTCEAGVCVLPGCDELACGDLGGTCQDGDCVLGAACDPTDCTAARGVCSQDGTTCDIPACFAAEAACEAAGGRCAEDGLACELPACDSDADCEVAQAGAFCTDPGDIDLAACQAPLPGEIVPPVTATGWTSFRVTDLNGTLLADASTANQAIAAAAIPVEGVVRLEAHYDGAATTAYVQLQSGSQICPELPPRTDSMAVDLVDGNLATGAGGYVEVFLHGGYQQVNLSTSDVLGQGDRSFAVEVGDACAPPQRAFVVILSWAAGPSQPADLDLSVWNGAGEIVFVGRKQAAWGQLAREGRDGPGPEVFWSNDPSQGPFTIKVQFFSGRPRDLQGKVRIIRTVAGVLRDETFLLTVSRPKDVAEIGVFAAE